MVNKKKRRKKKVKDPLTKNKKMNRTKYENELRTKIKHPAIERVRYAESQLNGMLNYGDILIRGYFRTEKIKVSWCEDNLDSDIVHFRHMAEAFTNLADALEDSPLQPKEIMFWDF